MRLKHQISSIVKILSQKGFGFFSASTETQSSNFLGLSTLYSEIGKNLSLNPPVNLPQLLFLITLSPKQLQDKQYVWWFAGCRDFTVLQGFRYFQALHIVRDVARGIPIPRLGSALVTSRSIAVKWI